MQQPADAGQVKGRGIHGQCPAERDLQGTDGNRMQESVVILVLDAAQGQQGAAVAQNRLGHLLDHRLDLFQLDLLA